MNKILTSATGLVAALALVGVAATANADGTTGNPGINNAQLTATATTNGQLADDDSVYFPQIASGHTVTAHAAAQSRVPATRQLRLSARYHQNGRTLTFLKAQRGTVLTLHNGKQQCVKRLTIARDGRLTVKLTRAQAQQLGAQRTFDYTVTTTGMRPYTVKCVILK
ncbi:hypothetical protein [Levilactobacillus acidifarinae]|nr:hypothetical protein [Levilactobacillus acidifarinae]GEO70092.1 hypothetical protein LAC03_20020 [Levilactobacillus acidifarinae]